MCPNEAILECDPPHSDLGYVVMFGRAAQIRLSILTLRLATEKFIKDYVVRYKTPMPTFVGRVDCEALARAFRDGGRSFTGANGKLSFKAGQSSAQNADSDPIVILRIQCGKFVLEK